MNLITLKETVCTFEKQFKRIDEKKPMLLAFGYRYNLYKGIKMKQAK